MVSVIGILFFNLTTDRPPMAAYDKTTWAQRLLSKILILCKSIDSTHGPYTQHQQMLVTSLWPVQLWWPNKNSCNPEVTEFKLKHPHLIWAGDCRFLLFFFNKSSFHWWRARYQMLFSHRKHCTCFKGNIYGQLFPRLARTLSFLPFVTPPWGKCTKCGCSTAFKIFLLPAVPRRIC